MSVFHRKSRLRKLKLKYRTLIGQGLGSNVITILKASQVRLTPWLVSVGFSLLRDQTLSVFVQQ